MTVNNSDQLLAKFMKALSNPTRISIIRKLAEMKDCTCGADCQGENCKCGCRCGEFVEMFPMSQSTVSQHIKELKSAGLINMNGRKGCYTLNHSKISEGLIMLLDLLGKTIEQEMENKNCNCGPNCQCGPECNCGPECQCGSGGECTCGSNCDCNK